MVHEKYTNKNGKKYGPYLYENKRVNGKIVTTYLGSVKDTHEMKEGSLFFLRIFSFVLIVLILYLLFALPIFFNEEYGFRSFFSDFFGVKKEVFLAPDPCVDLDLGPFDSTTGVIRVLSGGVYDYYINKNVTLCRKTYGRDDQPSSNGVIIINKSNIFFDCDSSIIQNNNPNRNDIAINSTNIFNTLVKNCQTRGFGRGLFLINTTNSTIYNFNISSYNHSAIELRDKSSYNYLNLINITPIGTDLRALNGIEISDSKYNKINNSFIFNVERSGIVFLTNSSFSRVYNTKLFGSVSVNGAIRFSNSPFGVVEYINISNSIKGVNVLCTADNIGNSILRNVFIINSSNVGINIDTGCNNISIENSRVINSSGGIVIDPGIGAGSAQIRDIFIINTTLINNSANGIVIIRANVSMINVRSYNSTYNFQVYATADTTQSSNVYVENSDFNDTNVWSTDVQFNAGVPEIILNISFINTSFASSSFIGSSGKAQLTVNWWLDVLVNNTQGDPLENANVKALDKNNILRFSELSDSQGRIIQKNLTEYLEFKDSGGTSTTRTYFTNYTINVTRDGYIPQNRSVNLTSSRFEIFSLSTVQNITACMTITEQGFYKLVDDIKSSGTCLIVRESNVSFDGQGFMINYSTTISGYGVFIDQASGGYYPDNVTIKNLRIVGGFSTTSVGIFDNAGNNVTIYNNSVQAYNGKGIKATGFTSIIYLNISDNNISTYSDRGDGIFVEGNVRSKIFNNFIRIYGNVSSGIILAKEVIVQGIPHSNLLLNNSIMTLGENASAIFVKNGNLQNITSNLINTTGNSSYGIYFLSLNNSIQGNIIRSLEYRSFGIFMNLSNYSNIVENDILTYGQDADGLRVFDSSFNTFLSNNILTYGLSGFGIRHFFGQNNDFNYTKIETFGQNGVGIRISSDAFNNIFYYAFVNTTGEGADGIRILGGTSNLFFDSIVNSSISNDVSLASSSNGITNFTNVSVEYNNISINSPFATLNVHWYVDALAFSSIGPLENVNITANDVNNQMRFSKKTGADGKIARQFVIDYTQIGDSKSYFSNYTFLANLSDGYDTLSQSKNITKETNLNLTFIFSLVPNINFTNSTPANASVVSNDFVEINVSIMESNLNEVKFNWNGTNYTFYNDSLLLMMNFENLASLGESSTFVRDLSRYGNDGTVIGATSVSGRYGKAFNFDGIDDIINAGSASVLDNIAPLTITAWIYPRSLGENSKGRIFDKAFNSNPNNGWMIFFPTNFKIEFNVDYDTQNFIKRTSTTVSPNIWQQVAVTWDGSTNVNNAHIYINGEEQTYESTLNAVGNRQTDAAEDLRIGNSKDGQRTFDGLIDEPRVWNRTLSADEVRENYYANLQRYNQTQWYLYVNQSNLTESPYYYQAFAKNILGNENSTEERVVYVDFPINITDIINLDPQNILQGSVRNIRFSANITGVTNLNDIINVNASISRGLTARYNTSCAFVNQIGSIFNYSCAVDLWYFDPPGEWNVSVNAYEARFGAYRLETFLVIMSTVAISHPGSVSWDNLFPGSVNQIQPFLLNNTANQFISSVNMKGINLIGQSIGNNIIPVANFIVGTKEGSGSCSGVYMVNGSFQILTGVTVPVGNNSINMKDAGSGQEELFICIQQVPTGLPSQLYSASGDNAWEITIG